MQVIDSNILQNEKFDRIEYRNGRTQGSISGILRLRIGGLTNLMAHFIQNACSFAALQCAFCNALELGSEYFFHIFASRDLLSN